MKYKLFILIFVILLLASCEQHEHTFSDSWAYDEKNHWHESTCGHDAVAGTTAHSWDEGIILSAPTHTTTGERSFTCTICGAKKITTINALSDNHTFSEDWSSDATYHWHATTCVHTDLRSQKSEHLWDEGLITKEPTHTEEGVKTFTCSVCGRAKRESIPALADAHTFSEDWSSDATYHWHASTCIHTSLRADQSAHNWDDGVDTTPATCLANGIRTFTCSECGATKEVVTKKTGHYYEDWTIDIAATKSTAGMKSHHCIHCGAILDETVIPATGSVGLAYSVNGSECTITGIGECSDLEIIIPSYIEGYKVTSIGDEAFADCSTISSITLSPTVTHIGFRAFKNCYGLTSFRFPETLYSTGKQIFYECTNLSTIYFDSPYLSYSEGDTVLNTPYITDIVFGEHVTYVRNYLCYGCSNLKNVMFHENIHGVGNYCFYNCTGIEEIDFPDSFSSFGWYGFYQSGLRKIIVPPAVTSIENSFRDCHNLEYIILPTSVTAILGQAFLSCSHFTTYYMGSPTDFQYISIDPSSSLVSDEVYYYSESQPSEAGKWWHYDADGKPLIWE